MAICKIFGRLILAGFVILSAVGCEPAADQMVAAPDAVAAEARNEVAPATVQDPALASELTREQKMILFSWGWYSDEKATLAYPENADVEDLEAVVGLYCIQWEMAGDFFDEGFKTIRKGHPESIMYPIDFESDVPDKFRMIDNDHFAMRLNSAWLVFRSKRSIDADQQPVADVPGDDAPGTFKQDYMFQWKQFAPRAQDHGEIVSWGVNDAEGGWIWWSSLKVQFPDGLNDQSAYAFVQEWKKPTTALTVSTRHAVEKYAAIAIERAIASPEVDWVEFESQGWKFRVTAKNGDGQFQKWVMLAFQPDLESLKDDDSYLSWR